jgi:outer membrane receptor protein involved in Fe transport
MTSNDFTVQASYSESFVAPSLPQLFTGAGPKPGYNKEGKKIVGEKAIAPAPEGPHAGLLRTLLANTTITFGTNNIFDTRPPLSVDNVITNFDPASGANYIQRFFWFSIDKKFLNFSGVDRNTIETPESGSPGKSQICQ